FLTRAIAKAGDHENRSRVYRLSKDSFGGEELWRDIKKYLSKITIYNSDDDSYVVIDMFTSGSPLETYITLPLKNGKSYAVTWGYVRELSSLYPDVNVPKEFKKMLAWLLNNPRRLKTERGIRRFINGWLSRCTRKRRGAKEIIDRIPRVDAYISPAE
ncbi:MAG: hypothetical protein QXY99_07090, partial [Thermoproteota archaeon]